MSGLLGGARGFGEDQPSGRHRPPHLDAPLERPQLARLELPVRHGEGRVWASSPQVLEKLVENRLAPLRYCDPKGLATETYPENPNGSPLGIAALCNTSGTVMGLMPHPEAFNHYTNHPLWTR